ncbi:hypothetical protein AAU61_07445 [Desulfocarbo indianensis]|nr:hypothetical protein AAU61_07445 [Desulfocarbo indianensis]
MLLVLFALTGWLVIGNCEMWFADYRQTEPRPATIKMVALRIDSNIMRAQAIMENLVYSDGPLELANDVKGLDQLVEVIYKDFQAMGEQFPGDNSQYQKALASFSEWKSVRDEAIGLTAAGPSLRAKEMVRGKSAAHVQEIRAALMALNRFSEKRALD